MVEGLGNERELAFMKHLTMVAILMFVYLSFINFWLLNKREQSLNNSCMALQVAESGFKSRSSVKGKSSPDTSLQKTVTYEDGCV